MTKSQFYTSQFYAWEFRGRGWTIADYPLQLEPPFMPFYRHGYPGTEQIDDGKRHSLASKFLEGFKTKKVKKTSNQDLLDYEYLESFESSLVEEHKAIQVKIPKDRKVTPEKMKALLIMLTYNTSPISFEIIGNESEIIIQFVCDINIIATLEIYLNAYFPYYSLIQNEKYLDDILQQHLSTAVVDFGLKNEFVRPLNTNKSYAIDPLITVFAVLEKLQTNEQAGIQILFQPTVNKWSESILRSVTMHDGTSFFMDAPDAPQLAREKVNSPLFGVSIRTLAQAEELSDAFHILEKISFALINASKGQSNELIPLSTQSYDFETRVRDIFCRQSHRMGMLLNTDELVSLLHFPTESIISRKLYASSRKTKEVPAIAKNKGYILGENLHNGITTPVTTNAEDRLKHTHIIGATGTGKSTLIANLILQDIDKEVGLVLFDPHGDLVDDIIARIPENRLIDVVLVDPSDSDFPIGLNMLQAHSDIEKEVLSSDLVAAFRRFATSWGDQMNTVFGNAIVAILENKQGGSLHDLRRFLIEKEFRNDYLKSVSDPSIVYYWQKEYPLLKTSSIGPILTRLDTFLRPKSIRNMVIQKTGLDFEKLLDSNKIILLKLSQGLIGVENSFLLGSLLLSKIHQAVFRRQQQANRKPIFIYLDEFQNFITPSIKEMLSGVRKYSVGLILSHQDLQQIQREDGELLNSVLGNSYTRIVFRVGEPDAKKLQDSFSDFDYTDLQNLGRGEAVMRMEQPQFDCSLDSIALPTIEEEQREIKRKIVIENSRKSYASSKEEVERILLDSLNFDTDKEEKIPFQKREKVNIPTAQEGIKEKPKIEEKIIQPFQEIKPTEKPKEQETIKAEKDVSTHRYLQTLIKKMAESKGYTAVLEMQIPEGLGQVDVLLTREGKTIAVEICNTTDADWEMHNIEKCLGAKYDKVISLSGDPKQLEKIKKKCIECISDFDSKPVSFFTPDALFTFLDSQVREAILPQEDTIIKGYRVNVVYDEITEEEMKRKRESVAQVVMNSLRKQKKK